MKRIGDSALRAYRAQILALQDVQALQAREARFEAPLGDWIGRLAGFALVLRLQGALPAPVPIVKGDRFNAQGLEGKIVIQTSLAQAVLMWHLAAPGRAQVFA